MSNMVFVPDTTFGFDFDEQLMYIHDHGHYRHAEACVVLRRILGTAHKFDVVTKLCTPGYLVIKFEEEGSLEIAKLSLAGV